MAYGDGIRNAQVQDTFLGFEDHGMFIVQVDLDYGHARQSYQRVVNAENCKQEIITVLNVLGVDSWERVKGKHARAFVEGGLIRALGHFLNDKWTDGQERDA